MTGRRPLQFARQEGCCCRRQPPDETGHQLERLRYNGERRLHELISSPVHEPHSAPPSLGEVVSHHPPAGDASKVCLRGDVPPLDLLEDCEDDGDDAAASGAVAPAVPVRERRAGVQDVHLVQEGPKRVYGVAEEVQNGEELAFVKRESSTLLTSSIIEMSQIESREPMSS